MYIEDDKKLKLVFLCSKSSVIVLRHKTIKHLTQLNIQWGGDFFAPYVHVDRGEC